MKETWGFDNGEYGGPCTSRLAFQTKTVNSRSPYRRQPRVELVVIFRLQNAWIDKPPLDPTLPKPKILNPKPFTLHPKPSLLTSMGLRA